MKGTSRYSVEIMLLILFFWRILEPSYNMIPLSPDSLKANKKHVLEESFYSALKSPFLGLGGRLFQPPSRVSDTLSSEDEDVAGRHWDKITGWKASSPGCLYKLCAACSAAHQALTTHLRGKKPTAATSPEALAQDRKREEGRGWATCRGPCR